MPLSCSPTSSPVDFRAAAAGNMPRHRRPPCSTPPHAAGEAHAALGRATARADAAWSRWCFVRTAAPPPGLALAGTSAPPPRHPCHRREPPPPYRAHPCAPPRARPRPPTALRRRHRAALAAAGHDPPPASRGPAAVEPLRGQRAPPVRAKQRRGQAGLPGEWGPAGSKNYGKFAVA
ncbi:neural Wiskott-Aldrich syndrome protein-like [Panicum virgatum]|uniref:neural Wiskott-Aldrich syndrome protein-like n=1 Tax=Panicum virgatum TaxID=38727 RepID=UPI0019D699D3|nr:neural Wiskott-Aldrich syndrome protein-like [Panicum virgatum]